MRHLIALLLTSSLYLFQVGCKCVGTECNITLPKALYIGVHNTQTGEWENIQNYSFSLTVNGENWTRGEISGDSLQYWYDPTESHFSKTIDYEGIIYLDNQEKCRLRWTLVTDSCCKDQPQDGTIEVQSGSAQMENTRLPLDLQAPKVILIN